MIIYALFNRLKQINEFFLYNKTIIIKGEKTDFFSRLKWYIYAMQIITN